MKKVMKELQVRYKSINDDFLKLFEKHEIVFIEDGVDLKKDLELFSAETAYEEAMSKEGIHKELSEAPKF